MGYFLSAESHHLKGFPKMMDFEKVTPFKQYAYFCGVLRWWNLGGPWLDLTIILEKKRPHKTWFAQSSRGISCGPGPSIDDNNRILDRFFALSHRLEPPTTTPATGDACCLQPKMWCSNIFFRYHPRAKIQATPAVFCFLGDQMGLRTQWFSTFNGGSRDGKVLPGSPCKNWSTEALNQGFPPISCSEMIGGGWLNPQKWRM